LEALRGFETTAAAMICTENASEGLNLQCAGSMVNFDLPWDPMRLEQRIGRIQRLGQKRDRVFIHNLFLQGTVEEDILEVLDKKIEMFGETVGRVEEILGNLAEDQSFDQVFLDLYLGDQNAYSQIDIMVSSGPERTAADQLLDALFGSPAIPDPPGHRQQASGRGQSAATATKPASETKPPRCSQCGHDLAPGMRHCDQCGRPVARDGEQSRCTRCRQPLSAAARFCDECGQEVIR
jgi:superfamily II DNA/RNA helicase